MSVGHGAAQEGAALITPLVHAWIPHSGPVVYLLALICAAIAMAAVYFRTKWTGSYECLEPGWPMRAAVTGAPVPVYLLMPLVPFDQHLLSLIMSERIVFAVAGLYAFSAAITDVRQIAGRAREDKNRLPRPANDAVGARMLPAPTSNQAAPQTKP